jgi:hypothetical protein
MMVVYFKTTNFEPDIANTWENVDILQNEVAFGLVVSPSFVFLSFIVVAVSCGFIVSFFQKRRVG